MRHLRAMKKLIVYAILFILAISSGCTPKNDTRVQSITYQDFIDKIWDFEQNPDSLVFKGNTAVIIDYYGKACRYCYVLSDILDKLSVEYEGRLTIYKVNVDEERRLAKTFKVTGLPAFFAIPSTGNSIRRHDGLPSEEDLRAYIEKQLIVPTNPQP